MKLTWQRPKLNTLNYGVLMALGVMTTSCTSDTSSGGARQPVVTALINTSHTQAAASPPVAPVAAAKGSGLPSSITILNATYVGTLQSLGQTLCTGTVQVSVVGSLEAMASGAPVINVPKGTLSCGPLGSIDLAAVLAGVTQQPAGDNQNPAVVENNVIAFKSMGTTQFSPPRPLLPALYSATASALATLDFTQPNIQVTTPSSNGSGTTELKMISYDQTVTPPNLKMTLNHVLDFQLINTGYGTIDRVASFIFDGTEFVFNTTPLVLVSLKLTAPLRDLAIASTASSGTSNPATGLIGAVSTTIGQNPNSPLAGLASNVETTLELEISGQEGLAEALATSGADSASAIGEQIGP